MAYNSLMLDGKKIVKELPNAPNADDELELDPESPMFFAQTHEE